MIPTKNEIIYSLIPFIVSIFLLNWLGTKYPILKENPIMDFSSAKEVFGLLIFAFLLLILADWLTKGWVRKQHSMTQLFFLLVSIILLLLLNYFLSNH